MEVAPAPFIGLLVVPKDKKQSRRRICSKYPGSIKLMDSGMGMGFSLGTPLLPKTRNWMKRHLRDILLVSFPRSEGSSPSMGYLPRSAGRGGPGVSRGERNLCPSVLRDHSLWLSSAGKTSSHPPCADLPYSSTRRRQANPGQSNPGHHSGSVPRFTDGDAKDSKQELEERRSPVPVATPEFKHTQIYSDS